MKQDLLKDLGDPEPINHIDYENQKFTCYGIRFKKNKLIVTIDNKNTDEFLKEDFPSDVDFNDLDQITSMIDLVRSEGTAGLVRVFRLPTD